MKTISYYTKLPYGILKISGQNTEKFLQGQLTCDVLKLTHQNHSYGACCNIKGRIQAFFKLFKIEQDYFLRLPLELIEKTKTELNKYGVFSKILIEDYTNKLKIIGLWQDLDLNEHKNIIKKIPCDLTQTRFEIYGDFKILEDYQEKPYSTWEYEDIEAGIPEITLNTYEKFLPHHLNLINLNAVSFTKGCYRGQEIIARMENLGNIKKKMSLKHYKNNQELLDLNDTIIRKAPTPTGGMVALIESRLDMGPSVT